MSGKEVMIQSLFAKGTAHHRAWGLLSWLVVAALLATCGGRPNTGAQPEAVFDGERAYVWVTKQCDFGYRIPGSEAIQQTGDMILDTLTELGWATQEQKFTYRDTPIRNLLAWKGEGPAVMVGAHYDTRPAADLEDPSVPVLGANDGASGVAVLLELARVLDTEAAGRRVYLAFFDAEDSGRLNGWDWIVGSTHMATHWGEGGEPPLSAMVLVDMVGDADQQIYYEQYSDPALRETLWTIADNLGYGDRIIPEEKYAILDDHIPFLRMSIPAVDMIDFDYPYWHTTQDTPDKVSPESLEAVGRTVETWLEGR
jgi:glutaminyl-peptide cyclotransferase